MEMDIGTLYSWLIAVSIFGAIDMFILITALSCIKTVPWW